MHDITPVFFYTSEDFFIEAENDGLVQMIFLGLQGRILRFHVNLPGFKSKFLEGPKSPSFQPGNVLRIITLQLLVQESS